MSIETLLRYFIAITLALACTPSQAYHELAGGPILVNGEALDSQTGSRLIQAYGSVMPGRYWMNAQLIGGLEGGPAIFNLGAAAGGTSQGGGAGYNRNTYGGSLMSDGNCSGYLHPSGASVMSGNC